MIIERTSSEIIFRLPANIDLDDLQAIADLLQLRELGLKSKARQEDVDDLVFSIKKGRWERTKQQIGK